MRISLKHFAVVSLLLAGAWVAAWAADAITLVKERSRIEFVGSKVGASYRGGFKEFGVEATVDWVDLSKSSFRFEIDAASLWSDASGLARHLKNRDFFDVSRYPKIEFETTRIGLSSPREAVVTGKLTMLGKSVDITVPCKIEVTEAGLIAKSEFSIDRTQWGMNYGKGKINDEVEISVKLVFGK